MSAVDLTDLVDAQAMHDYEMGSLSASEEAWSKFYDAVEAVIVERGWSEVFLGGRLAGQPVGLDGDTNINGYSIDDAYAAFRNGETIGQYISAVRARREALGL